MQVSVTKQSFISYLFNSFAPRTRLVPGAKLQTFTQTDIG